MAGETDDDRLGGGVAGAASASSAALAGQPSSAAKGAGDSGSGSGAGGGIEGRSAREIPLVRPEEGRGPGGLVAVGLDVGTGWTKVSALGRRARFPSLYSCTYAPGAGDEDVLGDADGKGKPRAVLRDAVGKDAAAMASGRSAILIRPVKHGVPHDGRGYSGLASEALRAVGVCDADRAVICAGVPYDARGDRDRIKRLVMAAVKPAFCTVLPQAYGTLKACGRRAGIVVNIGHGTTEIMRAGPEGLYGVSIPKASEFVMAQLAQRQGRTARDAYTDHDAVLGEDPRMTARLVELLAVHIADEIQQFGAPAGWGGGGAGGGEADGGILLSGGGVLLPGMREAIEKALGGKVAVWTLEEPSYSNAIGLEMAARGKFESVKKALDARGSSPGAARSAGGGAGGAPAPAAAAATSGTGNGPQAPR